MAEKETRCGICQTEKPFTICTGCQEPVCDGCSRFELIGSGCGCVWPAYYCLKCVDDPMVNPNAALREPVK
jgi:hypothetical protein